MKKIDEMRTEYRPEDLGKGVCGKHHAEFNESSDTQLASAGQELSRSPAMKAEDFDAKFDDNEDVSAVLDLSKAKRVFQKK